MGPASLGGRLHKENAIFDELFEQLPLAVALTNADNVVLRVNGEFTRIFGYTAQEAIGRRLDDLIVPDESRQEFQKHMELVLKRGQRVDMEGIRQRKDVSRLHVSAVHVPVPVPGGQIATYAIYHDITDRKRALDRLRESEAHLQEAERLAHIGSSSWDVATDTTTWSDELYRIAGRDPGKPAPTRQERVALYAPESWARLESAVQRALATGEPYDLELEVVRPDGTRRQAHARGAAVRGDDGRIVRLHGTLQDITERKRAQESLRESEEKYRSLVTNIPDVVWTMDAEFRFVFISKNIEKMSGFSIDEVYQHGMDLYVASLHPDDVHKVAEGLRALFAEGRRYDVEVRVRHKEGNWMWVHDRAFATYEKNGIRYADGLLSDITERKQAVGALRKSEERFRLFMNNTPTVAWMKDKQGHYVYVSETYQKHLGARQENRVGKTDFEVYPTAIAEQFRKNDQAALAAGHPIEVTEESLSRSGEPCWWLTYRFPFHDASGQVFVAGIGLDITGRKRAEQSLRKSRDQLRALAARVQTVREEERTRASREIHDELGQALTAIKIDLSSLLHDLRADKKPKSKRILKLVDGTIQSVRRISTELRPAVLDAMGLVAAIGWAAEEFAARTRTKCRLDLPPDQMVINQESATALFRILQETLTNVARHSNATEVKVRFAKEDGTLTLEVQDNGKGVRAEQLSAASSLGIMGMRERALLVGGELTMTGAPGEGTTMRVRIPETPPAPPQENK
jgi:PAS domain S-box-containing protein